MDILRVEAVDNIKVTWTQCLATTQVFWSVFWPILDRVKIRIWAKTIQTIQVLQTCLWTSNEITLWSVQGLFVACCAEKPHGRALGAKLLLAVTWRYAGNQHDFGAFKFDSYFNIILYIYIWDWTEKRPWDLSGKTWTYYPWLIHQQRWLTMAGFKRNHFPVAMRLAWIVKRLSMTLLEGCIIIMSGLQALPGQDIALTLQSS